MMIDKILRLFEGKKKDPLIELSGILNITYFPEREGHPPFISGLYGNRGVTVDLLNDKGFFDRWHPHTRVVVSLNGPRRESHLIAKRGTFFSRRLGEVSIDHPRFMEEYMILSSNPRRTQKIFTLDVANWVMNLKMPVSIEGNQVTFHQNKEIEDMTRIYHIVDALVYIANRSDTQK